MRHRLALLALAFPIVGACSSDSSSTTTTAAATSIVTLAPAANTTAAPAVDTAVGTTGGGSTPAGPGAVGIADFKFGPAEIHVPVGGSVVWTNNDGQQHTATSSTGAFDAGTIQPGASATVQFTTAGSFAYICSFHPFMAGTVVVG